jgi:hypothetical protein
LGVYRASCGHLLPSCVVRFEQPPHRHHCPGLEVECRIVAHRIPFKTGIGADAAAPGPLSVAGAREVDGDAEVSALGCAAHAVAGREASAGAGAAAEDAAGAAPAHAAELLTVPTQRVFPGQ